MAVQTQDALSRRHKTFDEFEEAFEQEARLDQKRRQELRKRAANRSRARTIARHERGGRVRFSVLAIALTLTVLVVTIVMFETLALVFGG